MISKFYYIIAFISFLCCSSAKTLSDVIKDTDGCPIIEKVDSTKVYYIKEDGIKMIAYLGGIEFNGGKDVLKELLDSVYYNNPDYHNYSEFNVLENFFILFDNNLNIKEVRVMYRIYADNERYYYDNIFVDALKNTTGLWHKTIENQEWYVYLHRQRIY